MSAALRLGEGLHISQQAVRLLVRLQQTRQLALRVCDPLLHRVRRPAFRRPGLQYRQESLVVVLQDGHVQTQSVVRGQEVGKAVDVQSLPGASRGREGPAAQKVRKGRGASDTWSEGLLGLAALRVHGDGVILLLQLLP